MKFYGTIETNLGEIYKEYGIDGHYSIDSLMFETPEEESFDIDFDDGDFSLEADYLTFRLKGLGCSFMDSWKVLGIDTIEDLENNYNLFNNMKLKTVVVHIPEDDKIDNEFLNSLKFKVIQANLDIQGKEISYDVDGIEVEYR